MLTVDQVRNNLQRMLVNVYGPVEIDDNGDYVVWYNSAYVFVSIHEIGDENNVRFLARFMCPLVMDVPVTYQLCLEIATEGTNYRFGSVNLELSSDKKTGTLTFNYSILANDLDQSEVENALFSVMSDASQLDTELHQRFGGEMFGIDSN